MAKNEDRTFDDSELRINNLSGERTEQIEKVAMPLLEEMPGQFRKEKPRLFKSVSPK